MKKLLHFDRKNISHILYMAILCFFALYSFSIFSFSSRDFFNIVNMLIASVLGLLVLIYTIAYREIVFDIFGVCLIVFCFSIFASSLVNNKIYLMSKSVFLNSALSFILYQFFKTKKDFIFFVYAVLIGGVCFFAYYLFHYRTEIFTLKFLTDSIRLGDYFDNQNGIARSFTLISLLSIFLSVFSKKYYFLTIVPLAFVLLLSTGSISNLLLFLIILFVGCLLLAPKKFRWVICALGVAIPVAGFFVLQLPQLSYFKERIFNIFLTLVTGGSTILDGSAHDRLEFALDAFSLFLTKPFFGSGPEGVIQITSGGYSHNNFSELAANYGLFGLVSYEALLLLPAFSCRRTKREYKNYLLCLISFLFLFQPFLVTFYTKIEYLVFPSFYFLTRDVFCSKHIFVEIARKKRRVLVKYQLFGNDLYYL